MADFEKVKLLMKAEEGGYGNTSYDLGGETKYGISKRSYPNLDIKNLSLDEAYSIVKKDFWDFYRLNEINDQSVANKIFIALINMNPVSAILCVQSAVNTFYGGKIVEADGKLGTKTIAAINSLTGAFLLDKIRIELCYFYLARVKDNITQLKFLRGWIERGLR